MYFMRGYIIFKRNTSAPDIVFVFLFENRRIPQFFTFQPRRTLSMLSILGSMDFREIRLFYHKGFCITLVKVVRVCVCAA